MKILVSSLVNDFDKMEEIALWVDSLKDPNIGVELIAFTHDNEYWERLLGILDKITCPITFHGPYIQTEATSHKDSEEYKFFIDSYKRVSELAKKHNVLHIVYHYSQLSFDSENLPIAKENSNHSINEILKLQEKYGVPILIENIAFEKNKLPLYNNEEYKNLFEKYNNSWSIIDVGHANINKLDIESFLEKNYEKVKAYHFHNNDGERDSHERIGNGTVDYKKIMELHRTFTPEANIVLEYEPHTNCTEQDLLDDIKFIKSFIK